MSDLKKIVQNIINFNISNEHSRAKKILFISFRTNIYSLFRILFLGNPEENQTVFAKHFDSEFDIYGPPITCVNLVEKTGREKIIGEAYLDNALALNRPEMNFVYFDFHEYCRGMKFENVNILIQALENDDYIKSMRYCWLDRHGVVCQQQGVFRINCIGNVHFHEFLFLFIQNL